MKKIRYWIKLTWAFLSRFKGIILIGVGFGLAIFLFLRFLSPILFGRSVRKIGVNGRYFVDTIPQSILLQVGSGLTQLNEKGEVEPGLASSWTQSDSGKVWTFKLDSTKTWQDGKKVVSGNINYNFEDVTIERPDEETVVFKLSDSFSPFPVVVARPVFKKGLLGTGEWQVIKLSLAGNYVERLVMKNKSGDKKIYKFYPTEERLKEGFMLGQVDEMHDIINPDPIKDWKTVKVNENVANNRYVVIFFNTQSPTVSDKGIRQGLSYAINKKELGTNRAISPISPNSWAYNPQVKAYDYSLERAKELIGEDKKINLVTTPLLLTVAEKIADNWAQAGVETKVTVTSAIPTEYDAFLVIYDIPVDPDQYSTWHSTQIATNISHYASPRIDKLLEDGRLELNQNKRRQIYLDFQRFLLEDAPAVFLYHPVSYSILRK